ncbi:MAG: alpha/beta fold hydrolase [Bacteroidota bacterium]
MPLIRSSYRPSRWWQRFPHLSTITPALLRKVRMAPYERKTLELDDGDFLDLDWLKTETDSERLVIILHGLEGAADRPYIRGMARQFVAHGWDALCTNHRGCSGRMNRLLRMYHMGASDDVARLVQHAIAEGYQRIGIVGFSLGGNLTLKYLGETAKELPTQVIGGVAFSVPCHIASANVEIDKPKNRLYLRRFLKSLNEKVRLKHQLFPEQMPIPSGKTGDRWPHNFQTFDDRFTGPMHGFRDAADYWEQSSSRQFVPRIEVPTLLVNASNDSFLSEQCYPREEAASMNNFWLEIPDYGGHVGFGGQIGQPYWSEQRALDFLTDCL